jgi:hypothetical protein
MVTLLGWVILVVLRVFERRKHAKGALAAHETALKHPPDSPDPG